MCHIEFVAMRFNELVGLPYLAWNYLGLRHGYHSKLVIGSNHCPLNHGNSRRLVSIERISVSRRCSILVTHTMLYPRFLGPGATQRHRTWAGHSGYIFVRDEGTLNWYALPKTLDIATVSQLHFRRGTYGHRRFSWFSA